MYFSLSLHVAIVKKPDLDLDQKKCNRCKNRRGKKERKC